MLQGNALKTAYCHPFFSPLFHYNGGIKLVKMLLSLESIPVYENAEDLGQNVSISYEKLHNKTIAVLETAR